MKNIAGLLLAVCILPAAANAQAVAYDFSALYERASPAVVQITTDEATGSGFLVTPFGHIATNYHVIRGSRYLAVQFPNGRKVKAIVAAVNPHYDMAVLKINSEVAQNIEPLSVLPHEKETNIKVGIPVVAIGSPLNQKFLMTQGILSKVESTIVMGDFLLQAGNSGGPLLNSDGEVRSIHSVKAISAARFVLKPCADFCRPLHFWLKALESSLRENSCDRSVLSAIPSMS
jgi:putative serine protease PepD